MRAALRGTTVGTVGLGLIASSVALAIPTVAVEPPAVARASSVKLAVTHTPYVGRSCVVGLKLTTATSQISGASIVVQARVKGTKSWKTIKTLKTKKTTTVKVSRKSTRAVQFRAHFLGTPHLKSDWSSTVTCSPKSLHYGTKSASVKTIAKKLRALHIKPASASTTFGPNTLQAVYAYQKSRILKRTGVVDGVTYDKIMATKKMTPSKWCKTADTICIDLSKQAAYIKVKKTTYTFPVSSGGGYAYYQDGVKNVAHTPRGTFHVYYKVPGATTGPLGTYFYISFFTGGYGVHGSGSVPTYAASHGCVREPRSIEKWVYAHLPIGAQVHVHD